MKPAILFLCLMAVMISIYAQTPEPATTSQPIQSSDSSNGVAASSSSFTNASGTQYSPDQLAGQLHNLRNAVDQTLPVLDAFTETVGKESGNSSNSVSGAISGLLSGVLNRNSATNVHTTNLVGKIESLLHTNAPASGSTSPNTARNLATLQQQLQAVSATLQKLNVGPTSTNASGPPLTPTGR